MKTIFHLITTTILIWPLSFHSAMARESMFCAPLKGTEFESKAQPGEVLFFADKMSVTGQNVFTLDGHVEAHHVEKKLQADHIQYNRAADQSIAKGGIVYTEPELSVAGEDASLKIQSRQGTISSAHYTIPTLHAHGRAASVELLDANKLQLTRASYSTCDPERVDWSLKAGFISIDQEAQQGWAKHVAFTIRDIPVFYFPILSFPVGDQRKSGFLNPNYNDGFNVPYYFNIAPNYDATVTARFIEDHGPQVQNEFRFLLPHWRGDLSADYMHEDQQTEEKRYLVQSQVRGQYQHFDALLDYKEVSDIEYFSDLGSRVSTTYATHLERKAQATYFNNSLTVNTKVQNFQTLDDSIAPVYRLAPHVGLNYGINLPWQWQAQWLSQWDNFDKDGAVEAQRLHAQPRLSARWQTSYAFISPAASLNYTQYQFNRYTENQTSRTVPTYSLDTGIFLERDTQLLETPYLQTLEPRLFYVNTPFRDQTNIPLFDSSRLNFNAVQLFQENRFSGFDRIGDTQHLAVGLTNRLIDQTTGKETLRFHVGEIFYFDERRVNLAGSTIASESQSDTIFDAKASLGNVNFQMNGLWDTADNRVSQSYARLHYPGSNGEFASLGYLQTGDDEQADLTVLWSIHPRWQFAGRWHYSLTEEEPREWLAGLQYRSCCFNLRLAKRRYIKNKDGDVKISLLVELELKGLVSVGKNIAELLSRETTGFR